METIRGRKFRTRASRYRLRPVFRQTTRPVVAAEQTEIRAGDRGGFL